LLSISPHLAYIATLPSARKQAINNKLQGSVATYSRCGGLSKTTLRKGLLLSLPVKKLKSVNIWQSCKQEGSRFVHFVRLAIISLKDEEFTRHLEYGEKQMLLTVVTPLLTLPG